MPQRRTAKKDLRQSAKGHRRNLLTKQKVKSAIKKLKRSVISTDSSPAKELLQKAYKALDQAAAKKTIHPNKAARKKSRLTTWTITKNHQ
ncbi:MAG: 30S ribosomal protein S20 [Candidatus Omnitrophota bacterium]